MSLHCLSLTFLLSCIFGEKGVAGINGREVEKEERCKDFNVHMEAVVWGGGYPFQNGGIRATQWEAGSIVLVASPDTFHCINSAQTLFTTMDT